MPIHSPSDPLPPCPFRLGGRLLARDEGDHAQAILGDAFAARPLTSLAGPCVVGDLLVVDIASISPDGRLVVSAVEVVGRDLRPASERGAGERVRLATADRARLLRRRAELVATIRAFFVARGYLEVETPCRVPSPGLDLHLDAFTVEPSTPSAPSAYLSTSPEYQMKRLLVGGVPRLFQLTRAYRRGEVGARHNPEFTILEWYRAFASFESLVEETEALVVEVVRAAQGRPVVTVAGRAIALSPPFERLPLARAFSRHVTSESMTEQEALSLGLSRDPEDEEHWFRLLVDEVEPALAAGPPVVLLDYPSSQASLARLKDGDARLAERFELFVGGLELCNGFGELADPREQRHRFATDQAARRAHGKPVYPIDTRFLAALDEGMPPACGNALGVDRLIALALGVDEIGDVLAFPEPWL